MKRKRRTAGAPVGAWLLIGLVGMICWSEAGPFGSPQLHPVSAQPDGGDPEVTPQAWLPLLSRHALIGELSGRIGKPLTAQDSDAWEPVASPDGRWIIYLTRPAGTNRADGQARLRVMATDGSCDKALALPPFDDLDLPTWDAPSFDDETSEQLGNLLFAGLRATHGAAAQWDLYRVTLGHPADETIELGQDGTNDALAECPIVLLSVAPGAEEGWLMEEDPTLVNLTGTNDLNEGRPALSPDGRWLAFDQAALGDEDWNIAVLDATTGARHVLTTHPRRDRKPAFSPDGRHIVFRSDRSGPSQIYRVDRDGGGLARLTFTQGNDGYPSYAPDGRHILFESDKGGTKGLYLMDALGRGRQVLLSDDRLRFATPSWDPSGVEILFSAGAANEPLNLRRMRLPTLSNR